MEIVTMQRTFLVAASSFVLACIVACGGGQPNPQNNAAPIPAKGSPEKTKPSTDGVTKESPAQIDSSVSWAGKLGKGKLGKGAAAYDEVPEPWRGQFQAAFKDELSLYKGHVTSAEAFAEIAKQGVAKSKDDLAKFEARNKQELKDKDPEFLKLQKGRLDVIAKGEESAKVAADAIQVAKDRLAEFEKNDPPYFRKPFVGCKSIRDLEDRLAKDDAEKWAVEDKRADAAAKLKAEEELNVDGLVLMRKTIQGTGNRFGGEITGVVVNRSGKNLKYVQITFSLYDGSGGKVGTAIGNLAGLESGERWNFKASSFGRDFATFKFSELVGY